MRRGLTLLAGLLAGASVATGVAKGADPIWRLEQPPPPAGAPFKVPLGPPGDLQFIAPNRGLLAVEGNGLVPRGLFVYDGEGWRQLATVCGGSSDTLRIAWAGPREFWTVSEPSRPRLGNGTTLCRFKDGEVVASYGTAPESADPYRPMNAATCRGANDCWFGGVAAEDATGRRSGAFHLRWDGAELRTVYAPQGRGVSDLEAHQDGIFEGVLVGPQGGNARAPELAQPEAKPRLLHRLVNGDFANDLFVPAARAGVPDDGTEVLGLDSDGEDLWAVGGGAASGPSAPSDGVVARPPLAARLEGGAFREIGIRDDAFAPGERFADVAAVPGSDSAWVAVQPFAERRSANARARVARIDPASGAVTTQRLPSSGAGRGSAARIACVAANDCWAVTYGGWLFHYTDGSRPPRDTDPAFAQTITFRPNESAAQFVPDTPPVDDSLLLAPPPVAVETPPPPAATKVRKLKPLLRKVRRSLRGTRLTISFTLVRAARVALVAQRGKLVVARTKLRTLKPGRRKLSLRLNPRRWPTRLRFQVRERQAKQDPAGNDGDTVTTGPGPGPATPSRG